jgi:hypothetical protein
MRSLVVLVATAAIFVGGAFTSASAYTVKGMGECKTWVGGVDDRYWLLGFISGYNYAKDTNIAKGEDVDDIFKFITKYCKENPRDDLADAVTSWIRIN